MKRPANGARLTAASRDALYVLLAAIGVYGVAVQVELFEHVQKLLYRFERWQLDELLFVAMALTMGASWYAWRRQREAVRASRLATETETHARDLLVRNRELSRRLIAAQERERVELARELHDHLGQCCNAVRVEAEWMLRADGAGPADLQASGQRLSALADDLYAHVHALLRRLRPADLEALGLVPAMQALCESWEASGGTVCVLHPAGDFAGVEPELELALYRVLQEALSNVRRHANAHAVRVSLVRDVDQGLVLTIQDDGTGFDAGAATRGLGLLGAAERVSAFSGTLEITSTPGAGTCIRARMPRVDSKMPT